MTVVRKIMAVADITIPPAKGDEEERKYRGVLYDNDTYEFFMGSEYYDWDQIDVVPEPILMALEYVLAWRALDEPDDFNHPGDK
jgi:hypothetical protein